MVSQHHLGYPEVRRQLSSRPGGRVVVQPENKETGPGLLLPLMHVYARYLDSTVAVFPSDHFIAEEELFMAHVGLAFRVVERDPASIVLLGIKPQGPEPEYGYILPGEEIGDLHQLGARRVRQFIEKPELAAARQLIREGGLWNTMVMVFRVKTLLDLVRTAAPALYRSFQQIREAIGSPSESKVVRDVYRNIEAVNFSTGMLEMFGLNRPPRLLVVPVQGVLWSDWGSEQRIMSILSQADHLDQPYRTPAPHRSFPYISLSGCNSRGLSRT